MAETADCPREEICEEERFPRLMALLYYFMAQEMTERLGEEKGAEAILHAVEKFGAYRACAMKKEAERRGLKPQGQETYQAVKDLPQKAWKKNPEDEREIAFCPMNEAWQEFGSEGARLGYLYCQIDHVFFQSFGMELERPLCLTKGDSSCLFILKDKKSPGDDAVQGEGSDPDPCACRRDTPGAEG